MTAQIDKFDFIIVGGGSAGCVLANRLTANPKLRVCLLEAGPRDRNPFIRIPLGIIMVIRNKKLNWKFWTEPQVNCANRRIYWPRGRTLGGSSAINAMCYVRGNPNDYDEWSALGNEGWSYKDVFPYFKKMEHFEMGENQYHGVGGPMNVAKPRTLNPLMKAFVEAGQQAGYSLLDDYNAERQEGVGYFFVAQKNGKRLSNAQAYLHPIEKRKNLTVITNAYVTKILFENKRAIGVSYQHRGQRFNVFAGKEVILSAGAINSPHILLLSGVGPRSEIEKHGLELVHHLPGVGENLQDHLDIHISTLDKTHTSLSFRFSALWRYFFGFFQYIVQQKGELTSNYTQATAFAKSNPKLKSPDLQWHFGASVYTNSALNLKPMFNHYGYVLMLCHLHPKSHGKISLYNGDPMNKPKIDPNYLAHEDDMKVMLTGFKKSREILAQTAFDLYRLKEQEPGMQVQTDEQICEYIRNHAQTIYHPVGTCKMGCDEMAVVDPKSLKIYGLDNIRVIDASVMPKLISGNTNAPTTMIAERGADMILVSIEES